MTPTIVHDHVPIFRVIRRDWPDPIDAMFAASSYQQ